MLPLFILVISRCFHFASRLIFCTRCR